MTGTKLGRGKDDANTLVAMIAKFVANAAGFLPTISGCNECASSCDKIDSAGAAPLLPLFLKPFK